MSRNRWRRMAAAAVCAASAVPSAWGWQASSSVSAGAEFSDNIGLETDGRDEAWTGIASVRVDARERSANVEGEVAAVVEYRDYLTDNFDDEINGSLDATADWILRPAQFVWMLENHYRRTLLDVLAMPTPDNRESTNVFVTGPEWESRLSARTGVDAGVSYGNYWFERSDADSDRVGGFVRLNYLLTPRTDASLNAEISNAQFRDEDFTDFRRNDYFVRLSRRYSRATLDADLGSTFIEQNGEDDVDGFLGRFGWHLIMNSYSGIDVFYFQEYSDPGEDIIDTAARRAPIEVAIEPLANDIFYSRHTELAYRWQGIETGVRVAAVVRSEDYQRTPRDRDYQEIGIRLSRELEQAILVGLEGTFRHVDYRRIEQRNDDSLLALALKYQINRHTSADARLAREQRSSNVPEAEYTENTVLVQFTYQSGPFLE